jgi:UDP-GlcNAc:undecaprenyl-phosphate GlcNAc-1-phosphate transferase
MFQNLLQFLAENSLSFGGVFLYGLLGFFLVIKVFPEIGLLDFPERYGLKRKKIPYPAGLMVFFTFLGGVLIFFPLSADNFLKFSGFLIGLSLLVVTSFIDDRKNISPIFRLLIQSIAAGIVIYSGIWLEYLGNPFSPEAFHLSPLLGGIITFIWILGFINTSNWLDGVPNLILGSGIVASFVLGALSLSPVVNQEETAMLCFIFSFSLLPFLLGNLTQTRFVLGDTGAMMIGFCLAVFSLFFGGKMATVLIVMAIPVLDGVFVFISRIFDKKSPLKGGDGRHFHDVLLQKGWKNYQIFLLYISISTVLGISVLFLQSIGKIVLLLIFSGIFFGIRFAIQSSQK